MFNKVLTLYVEKVLKLNLKKDDNDWKEAKEIQELRNKIMHHQLPSEIFNYLTPDYAQKAIKACRTIVKRLHEADGTTYPSWIDNQTPERYDK